MNDRHSDISKYSLFERIYNRNRMVSRLMRKIFGVEYFNIRLDAGSVNKYVGINCDHAAHLL